MSLSRLLPFAAAALLFAGCEGMKDVSIVPRGEQLVKLTVVPQVGLGDSCREVRSCYNPEEETVEDFLVLCYGEDGCQWAAADPGTPYLLLRAGDTYNIYAIVNVPDLDPLDFPKEIDVQRYKYSLPSLSSHLSCLPASGSVSGWVQPLSSQSLTVPCTILLSSYDLTIQRDFSDPASSFVVNSVAIRQAAVSSYLFQQNAASLPADVGDGDSATENDIAFLNVNSGNESAPVRFFLLENMQGSPASLADNDDPWAKLPEAVPEIAELSTYLELKGVYQSPGYRSDVTYRLYLGKDSVGNFDIRRGVRHKMTLVLTDDGLYGGSWFVEISESDSRSLLWSDNTLKIGESEKEKSIRLLVSHPLMTYDVTVGAVSLISGSSYSDPREIVNFSYDKTTCQLTVMVLREVPERLDFVVCAESCDSRHSDELRVEVFPDIWNPESIVLFPDGGTGEFASPDASFRVCWENVEGETMAVSPEQMAQLNFNVFDENGKDVSSLVEIEADEDGTVYLGCSFNLFSDLSYHNTRNLKLVATAPNSAFGEETIVFRRLISYVHSGFYTYNSGPWGVHPYGILSLGFVIVYLDGGEDEMPYFLEDESKPYQYIYSDNEYGIFWGSHNRPAEYLGDTRFILHTIKSTQLPSGVIALDSSVSIETDLSIDEIFLERYE